jgi:hypothetical protein
MTNYFDISFCFFLRLCFDYRRDSEFEFFHVVSLVRVWIQHNDNFTTCQVEFFKFSNFRNFQRLKVSSHEL